MILWTRVGNLSYFRSLSVRIYPPTALADLPSHYQHKAASVKHYSGLTFRQHRQLKQPESLIMSSSSTSNNPKTKCNEDMGPLTKAMSSSLSFDETQFTDKSFGLGERLPIDDRDFEQFLEEIKRKRNEYAPSIKNYSFDERRMKCINRITALPKGNYRGVCYWMFRDQRFEDNWALICAQKYALQHKCPLYVTFWLMSHYSVAGTRQYYFMLKGLQQVEQECRALGIQFHLELGYAKDQIGDYCEKHKIDMVIADMCPLRDPMSWVHAAGEVLKTKNVPLYHVDAHNIVPVWETSDICEYAAYTIRPKIQAKMTQFLTEMPAIQKQPFRPKKSADPVDWDKAWAHLKVDESVKPVAWAKPGTINGLRLMYEFMEQRLHFYEEVRNTPTRVGSSCLSPYYHFGQLSVQRSILAITDKTIEARCGKVNVEKFVEECVIRRELADNLCYYNQANYDRFKGAPDWAKKTINDHRKDKREYVYTLEQFQYGKTHDKLWNGAQIQMLQEGYMHGYMRMYWAKKIYEWSSSVEEALRIAITLNDKYNIDGRDPNGYTGIMWSICGVHDRAFAPERPVYGKIRCMTYFGASRKFDVNHYAEVYSEVP